MTQTQLDYAMAEHDWKMATPKPTRKPKKSDIKTPRSWKAWAMVDGKEWRVYHFKADAAASIKFYGRGAVVHVVITEAEGRTK